MHVPYYSRYNLPIEDFVPCHMCDQFPSRHAMPGDADCWDPRDQCARDLLVFSLSPWDRVCACNFMVWGWVCVESWPLIIGELPQLCCSEDCRIVGCLSAMQRCHAMPSVSNYRLL